MAEPPSESHIGRVETRQLTMADFDRVVELQLICFPKMEPWTREQFESQLNLFPEGQICVTVDDLVVASSASLIVEFDLYSEWHDWRTLSGLGFIDNHDPEGDTLYGIEIMVHPEYRGLRLARRLYDARKNLCREKNLQRMVIGGRMPGYRAHAKSMSASEYVEHVQRRALYDPVLTAQLANGFVLRRLIADYLPSDEDSAGFATHLEWINLDYRPRGAREFTHVQRVRVCAVQWQMRRIASFEEFSKQVAFFVDAASDYHADFVLFPELFTLELLSLDHSIRPALAARKLSEFTPQYLELFTELAVRYHVNILGGSQFVVEDERLFNVAYLFRRDGTRASQKKLHITPAETRWWGVEGGDSIEVFETDRGRVAINVCYDVEFPELARIAARRGAQILFVPFNTDERHGYMRVRHCAQARAVENHLYVVIAGSTGNLPGVPNADIHYAQSAILVPCDFPFARDGVANECQPNIETLVLHDLDLELLRRHRSTGTTTNWGDRRRDLYELRYLKRPKDGPV